MEIAKIAYLLLSLLRRREIGIDVSMRVINIACSCPRKEERMEYINED